MNKENSKKYVDYILEQAKEVLAIDSPTGFTKKAAEYVIDQYEKMGYKVTQTTKGGILVDLGGENEEEGLVLAAHIDTLGAIVSQIKGNGNLEVSPLGGMNPNNAEAENCRIYTRFDGVYEGTFQLNNASIHVNGEYNDTKRTWSTVEIVLDENVSSADDAKKLGIQTGDIVAFDPRTRITKDGYIKSRFLDDKLSVAIILGYAKKLKDEGRKPARKTYVHVTVYEEVGHGGSASIPEDITEAISVDMGCVGAGLTCTERQVSICAKDSGGPYSYEIVTALVEAAKKAGADYAVDIYPFYGSDVEATLRAGHDIRHGLIGAGVYASHGYERSHKNGADSAMKLIDAYIG